MLLHTARYRSNALQESVNDQLTERRRQAGKVGGKARNANNQIGMQGRIPVRLQQPLSIEDIDVDQGSAAGKMAENKFLDDFDAAIFNADIGIKFDLQRRGIAIAALNRCGQRRI